MRPAPGSTWLDLAYGPLLIDLPDIGERYRTLGLLDLGLQPQGGTPAEFAAFTVRETRTWGELMRTAGVRAE